MNHLGAKVILDVSNFGRYYGQVIGEPSVTVQHFAHFWSMLAHEFKNNDQVIFCLMNEPNTMNTETWLDAANAAIAAIRRAGAVHQLILVPGNAWTGAHSWEKDWYGTPNSQVMLDVVDPNDTYAYDMHQYYDEKNSGMNVACQTNVAERLFRPATEWLRQHGRRAFLGQTTAGTSAACLETLREALQFISDNRDQWIGYAWWAAGPWWHNEFSSLEPTSDGRDKPQMGVLLQFM